MYSELLVAFQFFLKAPHLKKYKIPNGSFFFFSLKLHPTKIPDASLFETSFSSSPKPQLPFPFGCLLGNGAKGFNDNLSDNGLQTGG